MDIIKYIDAFTGDVAKELDSLRLIIERTQREFNTTYLHYHFYNRGTKTSRKRTNRVKGEIQILLNTL